LFHVPCAFALSQSKKNTSMCILAVTSTILQGRTWDELDHRFVAKTKTFFSSGDFCERVMGASDVSALGWCGDTTFAFIGWLAL
jgi:hypothetical protein